MWAAYVFADGQLPVGSDAFRLVAALDLAFLAPMLVSGDVLLWRKSAWGVPVASIASVQASIYLLVLSLNSAIAIGRGLVASPGELPLWGPLLLFTGAATVALFLSLTDGQNRDPLVREQQAAARRLRRSYVLIFADACAAYFDELQAKRVPSRHALVPWFADPALSSASDSYGA